MAFYAFMCGEFRKGQHSGPFFVWDPFPVLASIYTLDIGLKNSVYIVTERINRRNGTIHYCVSEREQKRERERRGS